MWDKFCNRGQFLGYQHDVTDQISEGILLWFEGRALYLELKVLTLNLTLLMQPGMTGQPKLILVIQVVYPIPSSVPGTE